MRAAAAPFGAFALRHVNNRRLAYKIIFVRFCIYRLHMLCLCEGEMRSFFYCAFRVAGDFVVDDGNRLGTAKIYGGVFYES